MDDEQVFDSIVANASPYITLAYVLDDKGNLLSHFNFHPQIDEITIELDVVSSGKRDIQLTPDDVRSFAKKLLEFADVAEAVVEKYNRDCVPPNMK